MMIRWKTITCLVFSILVCALLFDQINEMHSRTLHLKEMKKEKGGKNNQLHINVIHSHKPSSGPYGYPDEVDLRIIVLTYNRDKSLKLCLDTLQNIHIDSHTVAMEIWIDRKVKGAVHRDTLEVAKTFLWKHGAVRVHVWSEHVGIYGQWIDTWRPRANSHEIAIFLEDDVDVSPYFYHWLRAAHTFYENRNDIGSIGLSAENVLISTGRNQGKKMKIVNKEPAYLYHIVISWGMSPMPTVWRQFQDWFYEKKENYPHYKPYTKGAALQTSWYKSFESIGKANTMWTIWFIHFCDQNHLYTLHPNLVNVTGRGRFLAVNRLEPGLHYHGKRKGVNSTQRLLTKWNREFIKFSKHPVKYGYDGTIKKEAT